MNLCYSADGEAFNHIEKGDLLDELDNDGELEIGRTYYQSQYESVTASSFMQRYHVTGSLLEQLDNDLHDHIGEVAGSMFSECSPEARTELNTLLETWITDYIKVGLYYKLIGAVKECQIEQGDIDESTDLL